MIAEGARIVGVKWVSKAVRATLLANPELRNLAVRGEVTNFNSRPDGTLYFELKEEGSFLKCVAWPEAALRLPRFQIGSAVIARGSISAWGGSRGSVYQLDVRALELDGLGVIQQQFEERKRRLAAEGLFDRERKRAMPPYPFAVALVSSRQAAGAKDFVGLLAARSPHVRVEWCETTVQGTFAPSQIAGALQHASQLDVDVIVVARGGGSFEDLFVFSDERVVRAVAGARHPVISAVGHTIDQQLCDLAADLHVETPSAAVESIGRRTADLRSGLQERRSRLTDALMRRKKACQDDLLSALKGNALTDTDRFFGPLRQRLNDVGDDVVDGASKFVQRRRDRFEDVRRRLEHSSPSLRLAKRGERLQLAQAALATAVRGRVDRSQRAVVDAGQPLAGTFRAALTRREQQRGLLEAQLDGRNPEAILKRGYAIVEFDGAALRDPMSVPLGAIVAARLARGTIDARVERRRPHGD